MAVWAYVCEPCAAPDQAYYVACNAADEFPPHVVIVRVRVGRQWLCARLLRGRRVSVDGLLVRDVIPTDATDCAGCEDS
jgi:hypothetical protein